MELKLFRAFAAVVDTGSINRAAVRLGCSQPHLSAQMHRLERDLGSALLVRMARGVVPTAAGREFYACAVDVLARYEDTRRTLQTGEAQASEVLRAGIIPTLSRSLLPQLLPAFVADHPRLDLRILEAYTGTLMDAVLGEELDFAVVVMPKREPALRRQRLGSDRLVLVGGRASGLTADEPVELAALPPLKLVIPSRRHSLRSRLDQLIDEGAFNVARTLEIDGLLTTLRFVRQSDFVALLPRMTVADELDDPRFVVAAIAETLPGFSYALVHRGQTPLSPAARKLIAQIAIGISRE